MCVSSCVPAGCLRLHSELHDVHLLGFTLLFPGRHAGQGFRSVRMWLRNTRGKAALKMMMYLKSSITVLSAFFTYFFII